MYHRVRYAAVNTRPASFSVRQGTHLYKRQLRLPFPTSSFPSLPAPRLRRGHKIAIESHFAVWPQSGSAAHCCKATTGQTFRSILTSALSVPRGRFGLKRTTTAGSIQNTWQPSCTNGKVLFIALGLLIQGCMYVHAADEVKQMHCYANSILYGIRLISSVRCGLRRTRLGQRQ